MTKYFLPPLIASFSFCLFMLPSNLIENWQKYSQLDQIFNQIILCIAFTPFIYITMLPIHGIGCLFIKGLKPTNPYYLLVLLSLGLAFGLVGGALLHGIVPVISGGLSGMVAAWFYYIFDKKDQKKEQVVD